MKKQKEQLEESADLRLFVGDQEVLSGDATSIRVVFHNLTGRNFSNHADPKHRFGQWLTMMEYDWQLPLLACSRIVARTSADHVAVLSGYIGEGLTRPDPEAGQSCLVLTYPYGAAPCWNQARMLSHKPESPLNRELFYFMAHNGCYPVTRETLHQRVWATGLSVVTVEIASSKVYLWPVLMDRMPSHDPSEWLSFIKGHVPGGEMNSLDQNAIQRFMKKHGTEALTDGIRCFTLAGGLAYCDPTLGASSQIVPIV